MIKLKELIKEGGKLFGSRAKRVSTTEMNSVFKSLNAKLGNSFSRLQLSKALPTKADHGDIDIVVTGEDIKNTLYNLLGDNIVDYSKNGNIHSILYHDDTINKDVHVDFINTSEESYDTQFDYLSYNDFSGILGVMARRLNFKYASDGFYKRYEDTGGKWHSILLSRNLRDGLRILGYDSIVNKFDDIQTIDDIAEFISSSDLMDSSYFSGGGMNRSDRKRMRPGRPAAEEIRDKLISLNKHRTQSDEDFYFKKLYPDWYKKLILKQEEIENTAPIKSKYGGEFIMKYFPQIKPGPAIGKIKQFWKEKYGNGLDGVPEEELKLVTQNFIQKL